MVHKFEPENKEKLDSKERREKLPPKTILKQLGLKKGDIVADIGCGSGFFTIPAGELVGEQGKVFALDISSEMLQTVEDKIATQNLTNIETRLTEEDDLKLSRGSVNFALLSFVLHEAENLHKFIAEVKRILSSEGTLAIIEWRKEPTESGPPLEHRVSWQQTVDILESQGFKAIKTWKPEEISQAISPDYYGVTARLRA
ncbi:class I SAM-dependent methyltransferase [Natranaerobius thermophilus]|uniref:Methyltransferase type 11 n=1 Tax=Natranaerobius thermophilus (strain ATCC BAA-1301 / DSM 18059 / JW/NM-WN-LF) TaxID=457570 RepID=B2A289_NATTJ|nr:methyltransferase domain-containing protein [Natranaerobius thermophilus]ACB86261.1 Methyltransferase type 11 [Natranaerobius thermophilus JW/NM-WN-LF]